MGVEEKIAEIQRLFLGDADIHFKQSELTLATLKAHPPAEPGVLQPDREERYDQAEQRLLDAADGIKWISAKSDHPFLILPYAQLLVLEAMRAQEQGKTPDPEFQDFLSTAEKIMKDQDLPEESVQGVYLDAAKKLWKQAGGA